MHFVFSFMLLFKGIGKGSDCENEGNSFTSFAQPKKTPTVFVESNRKYLSQIVFLLWLFTLFLEDCSS